MYLNPMGGEELQAIAGRIVTPSPQVIAAVKEAIKVKDVQDLPANRRPSSTAPARNE